MSQFEVIVATTHKDLKGDTVTKRALEDFLQKNINSSKQILLLEDHDFTLPPLGLIIDYRLNKRADGEYELIGTVESWKNLTDSKIEERMKHVRLPFEILQRTDSFFIFNNRGNIYKKESGILLKKVKNLENYIGRRYKLLTISNKMRILKNGIEFNKSFLPFDALFRRRCSIKNAYNLDLIDVLIELWNNNKNIKIQVRIDYNLELKESSGDYGEKDHWRGPKFTKNFTELKIGVSEYAPPEFNSEKHFKMEYWTKMQDNQTKVIEFEEINNYKKYSLFHDNQDFHFTKYCHAEFDLKDNYVKYFDIAIRLYTNEQYQQRRITTIEKFGKKCHRKKVIQLDGKISIEEMLSIVYMFFKGNSLLQEHFEEKITNKNISGDQKYTSFGGVLQREFYRS